MSETEILHPMVEAALERRARQELPPNPTEMDLLGLALSNNSAIDVIERIAALREKAVARQAAIEFSEALNRVQEQIKRIAPDLENKSKSSKYASYAAIDRVIRPIYAPEGFSLSFTHTDCPKPDHIRVICWVRLRSHKAAYQIDMPVDTKGPRGEPVMTMTHATASADSYAKRYLVKDIFNIAIGEDDNDGNGTVDPSWLNEQIDEIKRCETVAGVKAAFKAAAAKALDEIRDLSAYRALKEAATARGKELEK